MQHRVVTRLFASGLCFLLLVQSSLLQGGERDIRLPQTPDVSPNGKRIAFDWLGEIWTANIDGSKVRRLTNHDADDGAPLFSPDGKQIAFVSNRTGSSQIFVMRANGTGMRQVTFHSAGYNLEDWFPDGKHLLASGSRDHYHRDANRLIKINLSGPRVAEEILVDAMAEDAQLSPDGSQILFTREGERWWRKGYEGERSAQVWLYDLASGKFHEMLHEGVECMWPMWMPDGQGFYFTKGDLHGFDLWRYRFPDGPDQPGKQKKIYGFEDDSIVFPAISANGKRIVFRHLFDLYSLDTSKQQPEKIELQVDRDVDLPRDELRREFSDADEVAFTQDGLEIAFVAGGDVWVMDTKLREPRRVTETAGYEANLVFSPDGKQLWFTSVQEGQPDIWRATRQDTELYWWQNEAFELERVTNDTPVESDLRFTPDGSHLVFQQGRGDFVVMDVEDGTKRTLLTGFSSLDYDLSADSRWLAYAQQDNNFNSEIWLTKLDGSLEPVNVSRHPDNDRSPRFSPDGKLLAFTGRRVDREVDIYYVYLQEEFDDQTSRQRRLDEALELMNKKRKGKAAKADKPADAPTSPSKKNGQSQGENDADADEEKSDTEKKNAEKEAEPSTPEIQIDLDRIHERLRRISISDSYESGLLFSPDGSKLLFSASIDGKRGWYTVEFPDKLSPKLLSTSTGAGAVWSKEAGGILFLSNGTPAKLEENGKQETYPFEVAQTLSRSQWLRAGFHKAWLTMRDVWYDERYANKNWDAIRRKYADAAASMHSPSGLADVIQLMLGELNGSHLGFYPSQTGRRADVEGWEDETAHLGVRFDTTHQGPGLLVRDVLRDGPADQASSRLLAGDVILSIDGTAVDPAMDLTQVLNGRLDRDIRLRVQRESTDENEAGQEQGGQSEELEVVIRPISYSRARSLLYDHWLDRNRQLVEEGSDGKLGYLHIRAMDMGSFYAFERELYNVGYGREGLVIDVRDNGGGSTTDLLLTALTQPRHAITVPRGGGQGYPQDRAVFASWSKPIIVLCNQNSYSNAEIFSHAIKTLGRGQVVGVQTAGGVVSTGSATINDVGRIRVPFRGWFLLNDGEDMERNGCLPDVTLWPLPGELPRGEDRQLETAVELLLDEVGEGQGDRELRYAAERDEP